MIDTPAERIPSEEPLSALARRFSEDFQLLARQEAELAKREISEKLSQATRQAVQLAVGMGALMLGLLALVAAAVLGLALLMPAWAAALLVGGSLSLLGALLMLSGKTKLSRLDLKPQQAAANVRQDVAALKKAVES